MIVRGVKGGEKLGEAMDGEREDSTTAFTGRERRKERERERERPGCGSVSCTGAPRINVDAI